MNNNTILAVDRETYEFKQYKSYQIDLYRSDCVQVQDSLYAVKVDEKFT